MTGDQMLRFWDLSDLASQNPPIWKMYADHMSPAINPDLPFYSDGKADPLGMVSGVRQLSVAVD